MVGRGDEIREAARAIVGGDQAAYEILLRAGYDAVVQGAERAFRRFRGVDENQDLARYADPSVGPEDAVVRFLEEKLGDREVLAKLAESDSPAAYLRRSAFNFMVDLLRTSPSVELTSGHASEPQGIERDPNDESIERNALEPTHDSEELGDDVEPSAAASLLGEIALEDRVLLKVLYVERASLSDSEIRWLATHRGVSEDLVRGELSRRAGDIEAERRSAEQELDDRHQEIIRLQRRHRRVVGVVTAMDGLPAEPDPLDASELATLRTIEQLQRATPGARAALMEQLEERMRVQARLRHQARKKAEDAFALHPQYESAAAILGLVGPSSKDDDRRRAVNRITVRARRLRRRLQKALEGS